MPISGPLSYEGATSVEDTPLLTMKFNARPGITHKRLLNCCRRAAFTLIELLVVIAIIAILAVLIFTGAKASVGKAQSAKCMQNLRTLHSAFKTYAADNNGMLPYMVRKNGTAFAGDFWTDTLVNGRYLPKDVMPNGARFCPSVKKHSGISDYGPVTSVVNATLNGPASEPMGQSRLGNIPKPAGTILIMEGGWQINPSVWKNSPKGATGLSFIPSPPRHGKYMNAVFVDGHVEAFHEDYLWDNRATIFDP